MDSLSENIPGTWVILDQRSPLIDLGAALQARYGKQVLAIPGTPDEDVLLQTEALIERLVTAGETVTWLAETPRGIPKPFQRSFLLRSQGDITVKSMAQSYEAFPNDIATKRWRYWVFTSTPDNLR